LHPWVKKELVPIDVDPRVSASGGAPLGAGERGHDRNRWFR
jgi:hypothetical protein